MADAGAGEDAHRNIKVRLQEDPTIQRAPDQISGIEGLNEIWHILKNLGEESVYDKQTGKTVYKSESEADFYKVMSRNNQESQWH